MISFLKEFEFVKIIGAVATLYLAYFFVYTIHKWFIRKPFDYSPYKGTWAVVTGASMGVGECLAQACAARGLNVVVISRNKSKLEEVAKGIEQKYFVSTRVVAVDFTTDCYAQIEKELSGLDVSLVVNNVGGMMDLRPFRRYLDYSLDEENRLRGINLTATMRMIRIFLPRMIEKKRGLFVNIGTLASAVKSSYLIPYASPKAAMNQATIGLAREYAPYGIVIKAFLGGKIATPGYGDSLGNRFEIDKADPMAFANNCLDLMSCPEALITPMMIHAFQRWANTIVGYLPFVNEIIVTTVFNSLKAKSDAIYDKQK